MLRQITGRTKNNNDKRRIHELYSTIQKMVSMAIG